MVAQDTCGVVHQVRDLVFALAVLDYFCDEFDIIAPAGLDELLFDGCALVPRQYASDVTTVRASLTYFVLLIVSHLQLCVAALRRYGSGLRGARCPPTVSSYFFFVTVCAG